MPETDLEKLAERVEALTGPDRAIDGAIYASLFLENRERVANGMVIDGFGFGKPVPSYTASIDAAMTLVPEGWSVSIGHLPGVIEQGGEWRVRAHLRDHRPESLTRAGHSHIYFEGHHTLFALALCAAALKARAHSLVPEREE